MSFSSSFLKEFVKNKYQLFFKPLEEFNLPMKTSGPRIFIWGSLLSTTQIL
jgi:hypothetical protein